MQVWRDDNHALFKALKVAVLEHMDRIGQLCRARCADMLRAPGGRALAEFHLEPRFSRASTDSLQAALTSDLQLADSDDLIPEAPTPASWAMEQDCSDKAKVAGLHPLVTYNHSGQSLSQLLGNPELIIRQDHDKVRSALPSPSAMNEIDALHDLRPIEPLICLPL